MALVKNLASGTLRDSISASATAIDINSGEGSGSVVSNIWPATPFYISVMPSNPSAGVPNALDSEIMKVTGKGTTSGGILTFTVTRAQRGTTAKAFTAGAIITNAIYTDDAVMLSPEKVEQAESPWISGSMIQGNTIAGSNIKNGTIENANIKNATISPSKLVLTDLVKTGNLPSIGYMSAGTWETLVFGSTTLNLGLVEGGQYLMLVESGFTEGDGEMIVRVTSGVSTQSLAMYSNGLKGVTHIIPNVIIADPEGKITIQREYRGGAGNVRWGGATVTLIRTF